MKSKVKNILLALTGVGLFANAAMGAVTLESGSLAVAFYQVNGSNVVQPNTYIFDLGQANLYRENTATNASVSTVNAGIASSNINLDLVDAFGTNWATSGTVHWLVVGNVGATYTSGISGDPARTNYFSLGTTAPTVAPDFAQTLSSTLRNQATGVINPFFGGVANETSANNADGTKIPISDTLTVDEYVMTVNNTVAPGTCFKIGTDISQTVSSNPYGTGLVGALDMFRVLHSTSGADLTAGFDSPAIVGEGQYIGTLTLSSAGDLKLTAIPEPSAPILSGLLVASALTLRTRRTRPVQSAA